MITQEAKPQDEVVSVDQAVAASILSKPKKAKPKKNELIENLNKSLGKQKPLPPPQLSDSKVMPQVFAPFTYFGGKRRVLDLVWSRLGDTYNYVEPFFGSGAMTLGRPHAINSRLRMETVNDFNCWVANFWRAVAKDPDMVAFYADMPLNETDMHAWHKFFCYAKNVHEFRENMMNDPEFYNAELAGRWVWGMSAWITPRWATEEFDDPEKRPSRSIPNLGSLGQGVFATQYNIFDDFRKLYERMRHVRVVTGDWSRVLTPAVSTGNGLTGVFFDPPYDGYDYVYAQNGELSISAKVRQWCVENGHNPLYRIALCGYDNEHGTYMPSDWECVPWKAAGGFANTRKNGVNDNGSRERIWFSPHCLKPEKGLQTSLLGA